MLKGTEQLEGSFTDDDSGSEEQAVDSVITMLIGGAAGAFVFILCVVILSVVKAQRK